MLSEIKKRDVRRKRRLMHVQNVVRGSSVKPRFTVHKSNRHLFVQIVDDEQGKTLFSLGSMMPECKGKYERKSKETARFIGETIAKKALENKITRVVFDRRHYKYHCLIAVLADAAREAGLQF